MNRVTRARFNALAGYSRHWMSAIIAQELAWYEEADERILGLVSMDTQDRDFLYTALGRDAKGRFRTVDLEINIPSIAGAKRGLAASMAALRDKPDSHFYQRDEHGHAIDFFKAIVAEGQQHPAFRILTEGRHYTPALELLKQLMHYYDDPDGNFVQQFQSTGFDARLWEVYLYATLVELGYGFDRTHPAPDFTCVGPLGAFCVEATTLNPSQWPKRDLDTSREYYEQYVPIKYCEALTRKRDKQYWTLPHVEGRPLLLAIQDFHAKGSMTWSTYALIEALYGVRATRDGYVPIDKFNWKGRDVQAGFFREPESDHISAILANPNGTLPKFNRMGYVSGFGSRLVQMRRFGLCFREPGPMRPLRFRADVCAPGYSERWCDGLLVFHNPKARQPLDEIALRDAAHVKIDDEGQIVTSLPGPFFPLGTRTGIGATEPA